MTSRAFASQLAVVLASLTAAALAEAVVSAARIAPTGAWQALRAAVWSLGLWAVPCALVAALFALVLAAFLGDEPLAATVQDQWAAPERRERFAAGLLAVGPFLALVFAAARGSAGLHNVELAALLLALSALLAAVASIILALLVWRWARSRRESGRATWLIPLALGLDLLLLLAIVWQARDGLAQLDARLLAPPAACFVTFLGADRAAALRGAGPAAGLSWSALALATCLSFLLAGPRTGPALASAGAWSPHLIRSVQRLSDFDRDGYSGFLGGGDCAVFDSAIHPGAAELPGDGIDNNCIAGDAGQATEPHRPSWGSQAHGSLRDLDVVIVTIETLRHDHVSFLRAGRDTTPELKALAAESLVFERMYSAAPLTRLAVASLFSSYAPSEIDWLPQAPEKRMRRIGPKTPWLPELLSARGYDTLAVLTDFSAFTAQEAAGFERGFHHYDVSTKLQYRGGTMWGFPAAEQVDKAIALLGQAHRPFLLWLHLFEPHYSYEQPPDAPVFGSDEQARYDAEIWHVDHQLGRLVRELRKLGAWDSTVMFVSGDHGEAFGEHDDRWHGTNLFDPQLRPGALLRIPGVAGKRISQAVTFTDVAPTIVRVLGDRQVFDQLRGRSLTPLLHRGKLAEDAQSFVAESFSVDDGHAYQAALIGFPLKLVYVEEGRRFALYDLERDPGEQTPLEPSADPRAAPLMQELVGYLERARPRSLGKGR